MTKFQFNRFSRLGAAFKKPEGGGIRPPPTPRVRSGLKHLFVQNTLAKTLSGYFMLHCNFQFHLCSLSTFESETYDDFSVLRNCIYSKLSANFLQVHQRLLRRWGVCRIFYFLLKQLLEFVFKLRRFPCKIYVSRTPKILLVGNKCSMIQQMLEIYSVIVIYPYGNCFHVFFLKGAMSLH